VGTARGSTTRGYLDHGDALDAAVLHRVTTSSQRLLFP